MCKQKVKVHFSLYNLHFQQQNISFVNELLSTYLCKLKTTKYKIQFGKHRGIGTHHNIYNYRFTIKLNVVF